MCIDIDECLTANGGCEQLCINSIGGFNCSCLSGFIVANEVFCSGMFKLIQSNDYSTHFLMSDINECELGIASCSDGCTNTVGSYNCFCPNGYALANDNYTCIGKLMSLNWDYLAIINYMILVIFHFVRGIIQQCVENFIWL